MIKKSSASRFCQKTAQVCIAVLCSALLVHGDGIWAAQTQQKVPESASTQQVATAPEDQDAGKLPPDQLDSLVAPIALYPDPMLAQVLAASTYPLEIIQLQQWLGKNKDLKDKALVDAVSKQPWDPSIQGLAALPDVVKRLANDLQWTTDLGNAFLAQQSDVMDAVQRMRKKAKDAGNLKSTEQQKVETKVVESKQVIVVEQANPQVIYVPTYNPTVVYGPPVYPYPPIVYPPPPPPGAYVAGMAVAFGVGMAMGAAYHGGWGYNCGWGGNNNVTVNVNNNFNKNANVNGGNRVNTQGNRASGTGGNSWQHNSQHRGAAPYSDRSTANKYGGTSRGASASDRQANARQNQSNSRQNQANADNRGQSGGRSSQGQVGGQQPRSNDRSSSSANRPSSTGSGSGNRTPSSSANSKSSALGGGSSNKSGSSAKASSSRGNSSMSSRSSGGGGGRRR